MELRITPFDHPDAKRLIAEVQQEYVRRYGDEDQTPVAADQFAPPRGLFVIGYLDGRPVATGGWRRIVVGSDGMDDSHLRGDDAELKRMYVSAGFRGRGLARQTLVFLEQTAADAGCRRFILETGNAQPEAVALYGSSGYQPLPKYGHYRDDERSLCFAKVLDGRAGGADQARASAVEQSDAHRPDGPAEAAPPGAARPKPSRAEATAAGR
ncbi:GNAT superfamily N-acetyltransferase [Actinoalloteichus hoggarensis]|nr:GNAT family N-acetyltransferase [Actinoalloteichus hoggarensis]MBB5923250.1 GNAT superfamily N-acetyltransferase [Actinoalloteichus hoggarensis]